MTHLFWTRTALKRRLRLFGDDAFTDVVVIVGRVVFNVAFCDVLRNVRISDVTFEMRRSRVSLVTTCCQSCKTVFYFNAEIPDK